MKKEMSSYIFKGGIPESVREDSLERLHYNDSFMPCKDQEFNNEMKRQQSIIHAAKIQNERDYRRKQFGNSKQVPLAAVKAKAQHDDDDDIEDPEA